MTLLQRILAEMDMVILRLWPLLLLALVLWLVYRRVVIKRGGKANLSPKEARIWYIVFVATIALMLLAIGSALFQASQNQDGTYVPAHVEDGKLVPSKIVPKEGSQDGGQPKQ